MKQLVARFSRLFVAVILTATIALSVLPHVAHADSANLVLNPSFEQASSSDATMPADWYPESYGTNTASFSYLNTGHTGSHAVQTTVSNYQNGDAKWLFNALSVTAGNQYNYSDYYESTTSTNIFAQYQMTDGSYQYTFLGSTAAETGWTEATESLTVPSGVVGLSVFHVIAANGTLDLDDVSLTQVTPCSLPSSNGLVNGDFEATCPDNPNQPGGWQTETYDDPNATFAYSNNAHSGSKAVAMTNQTDGEEAGWDTTVLSPMANQHYTLDFWQNSDTYLYAYLTYTLTSGATQDVSLMSVPSSDNSWSEYHDSFDTPSNVQSMEITLATSGVGTVTLDQVSLESDTNQTPPNFSSPIVSLTFDDGDETTYQNGLPSLISDGFSGTFYVNGSVLNTKNFMTSQQLQTLVSDGEEIGSHLYVHDDMVQLTTAQLQYELSQNITAIQSILGSNYQPTDFASPYGSFTSGTIATVKQYEASHRDTDGQLNSKANFDAYQIHAVLVTPQTTMKQYQQLLTTAQQNDDWLVLVYHNIGKTTKAQQNSGEAGYTVSTANFTKQMTALKSSGISVLPVNAALSNLEAQL